MRRAVPILVGLALAASAQFAPFRHMHEAGKAERHVSEEHDGGLALHIHLEGRNRGDSSWREPDESSWLLNWFLAKIPSPPALTAVLAAHPVSPPPPAQGIFRSTTASPGIHDPPLCASLGPRPPPV